MTDALVFLYRRSRRNALVRLFRRLRDPKRLFGALLTLGFVGLMVFGAVRGGNWAGPSQAPAVLTAYLALTLVMSVFGGLSERGIPFSPSEVEFLFPGPFSRRALVLYRTAGFYPAALLQSGLPFLFFGVHTPRPGAALLGCFLCSICAQHLQLISSIFAIQIGERAWRRLRVVSRVVLFAAFVALFGLLAASVAERGGLRNAVAAVVTSPAARIAFYPAVAAGEMAAVTTIGEALAPALGSLAFLVASLLLLLGLQVNFLEASIGASERLAARKQRLRRGGGRPGAAAESEGLPIRVRIPALPLFRGAGAVAWKNLLVVRRSVRMLVFTMAFAAMFFVPTFLVGDSSEEKAFLLTAVFPLFLSTSLSFDFRSEADQISRLKCLPVSRFGLAAAEVAVSTGLALTFQGLLLVSLVALDRVRPHFAALAFVAYVPFSAGIVASMNLAFLWVSKGLAASLFQIVLLVADLAVMVFLGWVLHEMGLGLYSMLPILFTAQMGLVVLLLWLIGRAFDRHDVSAEVG